MTGIFLTRSHAFLAFVIYLALIVYGSLVPFEVRENSLDSALTTFLAIPYLKLGVASRADWVANIVLYVPLAFLGSAWLAGFSSTRLSRFLSGVLMVGVCLTVAVVVEFAQVFIAPRTVSQNDLIAETLGTLGGVAIWMLWGRRLLEMMQEFVDGGRQSLLAAITLYLIAYVALSLFPFDFLVSARELAGKLSSGALGWIVAGECNGWVRCVAPRLGEILAIVPLGMLVAAVARRKVSDAKVFVAGLVLGSVLELMQVFIASGITQGLSAVLRAIGLLAGLRLGYALKLVGPEAVARTTWGLVPYAAVPYLLAVAALSGWFRQPWVAMDVALERLGQVRLMPFYYHYFTTEREAMASLLAQVAIYAPVGIAAWARHASVSPHGGRHWTGVALAAAAIALPFELGKLFGAPDQHPDPTNLLIAAVSAAVVYALGHWLEAVLSGSRLENVAATPAVAAPVAPGPPLPMWAVLISIAAAVAAVLGVLGYPTGAPVLGFALLIYGVLLYRQPTLWLLVVPGLLPILDLSPITGRLLLDEFDLFVLVTLAVGCWRSGARRPRRFATRLLPFAIVLLWMSWALSTARGLWPGGGSSLDGFSINSSHSPLEAWQVGKGLLWALLLVPLLRRVPRDALEESHSRVMRALVSALMVLILVVLWERHVFVGLADFASVFRVTGTFASMRTGGAYIDAFVAFAFPVLVVWVMGRRDVSGWVFGVAACAATSYVMLVTFSRVGYAALMVGIVVVLIGVASRRRAVPVRRIVAVAALMLVVLAAALPVLSGKFAQQRLARSMDDLAVRMSHWEHALDLVEPGVLSTVTGMGFGRYPILYLQTLDGRAAPGTYRVAADAGNAYLQLGAGEPVYLEQRISHVAGTPYTFSVRLRQRGSEKASLRVALCEKALLYSFKCVWVTPNQAPVVSSLTATPALINDTQKSRLQVTAFDPDRAPSVLSYAWSVPPGEGSLDDPASPTPVYTPPDVGADTEVTLTVIVSDGKDSTRSGVTVNVNNAGAQVPTTVFFDDFEDGALSPWSSLLSGTVNIVDDGTGNHVLRKFGANDPNGGIALLGATVEDFDFIVFTRRVDSSGGSANRYAVVDANGNGYGLWLSFSQNQLGLERRDAWAASYLDTTAAPSPWTIGTWYTLRLTRRGDTVTAAAYQGHVYTANDTPLVSASATDSTHNAFSHVSVNGGFTFESDEPIVIGSSAMPPGNKAPVVSSVTALKPGTSDGDWTHDSVVIDTASLTGGPWPGRPVRLSLYNPGQNSVLHVDDVSLKTSDGREMLANGDFSDDLKRWLLVSDQDLAWHIHQQALEIYFAQGLLGLLALLVLVLGAGKAMLPGLRQGMPFAIAMTGAVACFLTVGLLSSVADTARSSMLLYLGALAGGLLMARPAFRRRRSGHNAGPEVSVS